MGIRNLKSHLVIVSLVIGGISVGVPSGGIASANAAPEEEPSELPQAPEEPSVAPAGFQLVAQELFYGRRINLWRNTSNNTYHGEIDNAIVGDAVFLRNGPRFVVPGNGIDYANTNVVTTLVDVCGYIKVPNRTKCTCVVC